MDFTITEVLDKKQAEYDIISIDPNITPEQRALLLEELNNERKKLIVTKDAYAIGTMIELLIKKLDKIRRKLI